MLCMRVMHNEFDIENNENKFCFFIKVKFLSFSSAFILT